MRAIRLLGVVVPVLAAVGVTVALVAARAGPERHPPFERAVPVTVVQASEGAPAPLARGFGTARPAETWQAVAEVRGSIVWRHPDLARGNLIPGSLVVLEIDPSEYRLALA